MFFHVQKKEIRNTKMFSRTCGVQFRRSFWVRPQEISKLFPLKSQKFFLKLKKNQLLFKKSLNMFLSLTQFLPKVASYKKDFLKNLHKKKPKSSEIFEGKKLVLDNLLKRQFSTYCDGLKKYRMLWKFKQLNV